MLFQPFHEHPVVAGQVDRKPHGLRYVPGQVEVKLQPVSFWIANVDGHGIPVGDWRDVIGPLFDQQGMHLAQRSQAVGFEGNLVDRIEGRFARSPADEHDLVVFFRIPAQKHKMHGAVRPREISLICHGEVQDSCVEVLHLFHVSDVHTEVAEAEAGSMHGFSS